MKKYTLYKTCFICHILFVRRKTENLERFKGRKYCSKDCANIANSGKNNSGWKVRLKHSEGYILIHQSNHPTCNSAGCVPEHRVVMEKHLDRYLSGTEIVHHINGKRDDNRIENLILLSSQKEHIRIHSGWRKIDGKWFKQCKPCGKILEANADNFYFRKTGKICSYCKKCGNLKRKEWREKRR